MNKTYSILVYCGDVLGLGHLRRNTAIVSRLVEELPGSNALVITSLPAGNFFECPKGVDFIKLPSLSKDESGRLVARNLTVPQEEFQNLRTNVIDSTARSFRPDLLLVDHLPTGMQGELLPTLRAMKASSEPPFTVLGLRDILDDPQATMNRWHRRGVYRSINEHYDAVLVYGSRDVIDTGLNYQLDDELTMDVTHCGYVCAEANGRAPKSSRRELGLGEGKLMVITAGGGADGYPMMKLCLRALRQLDAPADLEVVCITGPLMSREQVADLRARSAGLPVRVFWCVEGAPLYLRNAALVVTMAGYNSLMEAVRLRKKTLVVPRLGPSTEQTMRTEIFSGLGLVRGIRREERTPYTMARVIAESLDAQPPSAALPDMDGLPKVVHLLKRYLADRGARVANAAAGG